MGGGPRFINLFGNTRQIRLAGSSFSAGAAAGTAIGTLSVIGGVGTYTFTLLDSAGNRVQLAGGNGQNLQVGATPSVAGTFTITVRANNGAGSIIDQVFVITAVAVTGDTLLVQPGDDLLVDVGNPLLVQ